MPAKYSVFPECSFIFFEYEGDVTFKESAEIVRDASMDPKSRPFMNHLCDLSRVKSVETDPMGLLKLQARMAENLTVSDLETVVVFYAPTLAGKQMAALACRAWANHSTVKISIVDQLDQAFRIVGARFSIDYYRTRVF